MMRIWAKKGDICPNLMAPLHPSDKTNAAPELHTAGKATAYTANIGSFHTGFVRQHSESK